ncbi:HlyD family efflux transporter periplasmic adaptor subunit [Actinoallomurus acanthiterrae]
MYADRGYAAISDGGDARTALKPPATKKRNRTTGSPARHHSVSLPAGEVVFVPEFPARVLQLNTQIGAEAKGTIIRLGSGELLARASVQDADRRLLRRGQRATIIDDGSGTAVSGRLQAIGRDPGSADAESGDGKPNAGDHGSQGGGVGQDQTDQSGYSVSVKPVRPLNERFAGEDVRVTIDTASTPDSVLVVPQAAIFGAADGSTQVIKLSPTGRQRRIAVTPGTTAGGFIEVRTDQLAPGDRVVVGS